MNLKNLRLNYPKLLSYLERHNYSKGYVSKFRTEIKHILNSKNSDIWSCYKDVYNEYVSATQSHGYLREKRTIIGAIERFDVYGEYSGSIVPGIRLTENRLSGHRKPHFLVRQSRGSGVA